jgi:hypothetical protein
MKYISPLLLLPAIVCLSCEKSSTPPAPVNDTLVATYAQILALNEQYKAAGSPADSADYREKVKQVLSEHGFTEETFRAGILSEVQSAGRFHLFQDSVIAKLEARKPKP